MLVVVVVRYRIKLAARGAHEATPHKVDGLFDSPPDMVHRGRESGVHKNETCAVGMRLF